MSRSGVFLGLFRWNHCESSEHGPFILFTRQLYRTASVCCVLRILMVVMIHKLAQEQNMLSLTVWLQAGLIFTFFLSITLVFQLACLLWKTWPVFNVGSKEWKRRLWFGLNVGPCSSTESYVEKARRYILKTSILVVWAIIGGIQHFWHFCITLGYKDLKNVA